MGLVKSNKNIRLFTIKQCTSAAFLNVMQFGGYSTYTGGFIGCFYDNRGEVVEISDSSRSSYIGVISQTSYTYASGLIGRISFNTISEFLLTNDVNHGTFSLNNITGEFYGGGFVGEAYENGGKLLLNNVTNKIETTLYATNQWSHFGGLVGIVAASSQNFSLEVKNSANNGNIGCEGGNVCGLFCVSEKSSTGVQTSVTNCINKGMLTGNNVFGLANKGAGIIGYVSMGTLTGRSSCQSFIPNGGFIMGFQLEGICTGSTDGTFFKKNSDGLYYTSDENKRVDEELNVFSTMMQLGRIWDTELNLFDALRVMIGNPVNKTVFMRPGDKFQNVSEIGNVPLYEYVSVDRSTWNVLTNESIIEKDMDVAICVTLSVSGALEASFVVEYETPFSGIRELEPFLNKKYVIYDSRDANVVYNEKTIMENDTSVVITKVERVVIEVDGVEETEVDVKEIIRVIEGATEGVRVIGVDVVRDDDGKVTKVTVIVSGEEAAQEVVNAVEAIEKGEGCGAGVLCRRGRVYVEGEELDTSGCMFLDTPKTVFGFAMVILFFMILSP